MFCLKEEGQVDLCATNNCDLQIWDFNLGRLRGNEESSQLEVAYGGGSEVFTIKNFGELMKETNTDIFGDMYQMNIPVTHDDMTSFNVSPEHSY